MLTVLQPVSTMNFNLATNAAVLNTWTRTPLVMSGAWAPAVYREVTNPVLAGTDVARTMLEDDLEQRSFSIPETPLSDKMFDMIIGGTPETSFINEAMLTMSLSSAKQSGKAATSKEHEERSRDSNLTMDAGTSEERGKAGEADSILVDSKTSRDSGDVSLFNSVEVNRCSQQGSEDATSLSRSISIVADAPEYERLFSDLESSDRHSSLPSMLTSPQMCSSPKTTAAEPSVVEPIETSDKWEEAERLDYEVLSGCMENEKLINTSDDAPHLLGLLTVLTTEDGLDAQEYRCNSCDAYIGMIYGKPRLCYYDSKYYCYECHEGETAMIPARIIYNWDFSAYPVSLASAKWLRSIHHQPLINVRTANPKLYWYMDDLSELQVLRTQLLYLRAYLFTCRSDAGQALRKLLWPREHLYEHVHLYSIYDFHLVSTGQLVPRVRQAVTWSRSHVLECPVCAPRGFRCEMCSDKEIIYPFQLGNTYTCSQCFGVFHAHCAKGRKDCQKCKRLEARKVMSEVNLSQDSVTG